MGNLFLLFVVLPAVELVLLIEIGSRIGSLTTILLIVVTGAVGATLVRLQGLGVLGQVQREMQRGELPADAIFDGVILVVAGALLVTPGVLTDAFGFLCLVPAFRALLKSAAARRMERAVREGRVHVVYAEGGRPRPPWPHEPRTRPVEPERPPELPGPRD